MAQHRAARPVKRRILMGVGAFVVAVGTLAPVDGLGEAPWAEDTRSVSAETRLQGSAPAPGAGAPVDPAQAALEMAQEAQRAAAGPAPTRTPPSGAQRTPSRSTGAAGPAEATSVTTPDAAPPKPATLTGRVLTPRGEGLDNVVVEALAVASPRTPMGEELVRAPVAATVLSGSTARTAAGEFSLRVPPGRYVVRFRAAPGTRAWRADLGGRGATTRPLTVGADEDVALRDHTMRLGRPVAIRGLVWDERSGMVPGVVVQLIRWTDGAMVPVDFAMTDENGAFEFPLASRGERYTVRVRGGSTTDGDLLPVTHAWLGDTTDPAQARWIRTGDGAARIALGPIRVTEGLAPTAAPRLRGDVRIGQTVEVSAGEWNTAALEPEAEAEPESDADPSDGASTDTGDTGPGIVYQWLLDGAEIENAVGPAYAITAADLGATLSVRVRATIGGGSTDAYAVPALVRRAAPPTVTKAPRITGDPSAGQPLRVDVGTWRSASGDRVDLTVAWQRDGIPVPGATGRRHRVQAGDVGHEITATVSATAGRSDVGTATTEPVRVADLPSRVDAALDPGAAAAVDAATGTRVAVTVSVPGVAEPVGDVLVVDDEDVLAEAALRQGDRGRIVLGLPRGARGTVTVVFRGGAGVTDSRTDVDLARRR